MSHQYELLPYPIVDENQLQEEETWYQHGSGDVMSFFPGINLERLNHYLHLGGETFR